MIENKIYIGELPLTAELKNSLYIHNYSHLDEIIDLVKKKEPLADAQKGDFNRRIPFETVPSHLFELYKLMRTNNYETVEDLVFLVKNHPMPCKHMHSERSYSKGEYSDVCSKCKEEFKPARPEPQICHEIGLMSVYRMPASEKLIGIFFDNNYLDLDDVAAMILKYPRDKPVSKREKPSKKLLSHSKGKHTMLKDQLSSKQSESQLPLQNPAAEGENVLCKLFELFAVMHEKGYQTFGQVSVLIDINPLPCQHDDTESFFYRQGMQGEGQNVVRCRKCGTELSCEQD